jgi:hypothetical protein
MTRRPTAAELGSSGAQGSLLANKPIILVSGATKTMQRLTDKHTAGLGHLLTPRSGNSIDQLLATGLPIAADNDCFIRLDYAQYLAMLDRLKPHADRVAWVTVPDIVGDARATLRRWRLWRDALRRRDLRAAYVAQDGSEDLAPPWNDLDCLFIGGSTAWKLGKAAERLIREADDRGKWVHIGRVNTLRRMRWFSSLPVDSFDGSGFSRWPDKRIPWMLKHLGGIQHRMDV